MLAETSDSSGLGGYVMAFVFQYTNLINAGTFTIANGDTVFVTDGTIIANDQNYTVVMSGGVARSLFINYGDVIGNGFATVYMGAANSVVENHGLIRNTEDSTNMRPALLIATAGNHRVVNNGEISSAGRVIDVNGAAASLSYTIQNHGLMQALYGHDLLRDGDYAVHVTVENTGTMRGGEIGMSGTGRAWLDNSGVMEVTQIDGAAVLGLQLFNTGTIEGFETSNAYLADAGEVWIQGSETQDVLRNSGTIRGDFDGGSGPDAVYNSGVWVGDLTLGYGNDTIYGYGGSFEGVIDGGQDDDRFVLDGGGAVTVIGGDGQDTLVSRGDVLAVSEVEVIVLMGSANLEVQASDGAEDITGNIGDNVISGWGGADTIRGGAGNDVISGGEGNDLLYGNGGADDISGGAGQDTLYGGAGSDTLDGGTGADNLNGESGADVLDGGDGNDALNGGFGNDTMLGGAGSDTLLGMGDHDYIEGGADADRMVGGDGNDTLIGGSGNDTITGDAGDDVIQGGTGYDILIGKSGADTFVFDSAAEMSDGTADRIKDFERGRDIIDISGIDDERSFTFIGTSAFSATGGMEIRYVMNAFGAALVYADTNGDGVTDGSFIMLNVPGGITADDFIL